MTTLIVLSASQLLPVVAAQESGEPSAEISPDLGLTQVLVNLSGQGIQFPSGEIVSWADVEMAQSTPQSCFELTEQGLIKVQAFSEFTNRHYALMATTRAPTMLVSGIPMHRIKDIDPYADTLAKIRVIKPVVGVVLDTATGLGYTAIEASKTADQVFTIELDPTVMEIIHRNPWSQPLLNNPKIEQLIGDSFDRIQEFEDGFFSRIIHDPPMISLAGELYSTEFYYQVYRVLRHKGILFHYIGDLDSNLGNRVARGVVRRLQEAGFRRISKRKQAFGLLATR